MDLDTLRNDYKRVELAVSDGTLPQRYVLALSKAQELLQPLLGEDTSEWVSQYYRDAYQDWRNGDRDESLCTCSSRRCRLKHGTLPYQLRRRQSALTSTPSPEEQLQEYLKRHPEAIVISEALDALRDRKVKVARHLSTIEHSLDGYRGPNHEDGEHDPLPAAYVPGESDAEDEPAADETDETAVAGDV